MTEFESMKNRAPSYNHRFSVEQSLKRSGLNVVLDQDYLLTEKCQLLLKNHHQSSQNNEPEDFCLFDLPSFGFRNC